jgi:sugar lactone lactonase YvrE
VSAELLEDTRATLGEGPNLFPDGSLWWVDIPEGKVFSRTDFGSQLISQCDDEVSKALPWSDGHIALTARGVELVTTRGDILDTIDVTHGDSTLRCSDGVVLPSGGIAVGVVDKSLTAGRGRLVVIQPDGSVVTIVDHATIPNGIDVHPSGESLWWVDSPTQIIMRCHIDPSTGLIHDPTPWASVPPDLGVPDGVCADREGGVWVALWGGGAVIHFDDDGSHDQTISVPVSHVTSCAFDADDNLIVTSGNAVLTEKEKQTIVGAGGLWSISPDIHHTSGLPPRISRLSPRDIPLDVEKEQP